MSGDLWDDEALRLLRWKRYNRWSLYCSVAVAVLLAICAGLLWLAAALSTT
jgi:hypothetical protein